MALALDQFTGRGVVAHRRQQRPRCDFARTDELLDLKELDVAGADRHQEVAGPQRGAQPLNRPGQGELRDPASPLAEQVTAWALMGANVFLGLRFAVWGDSDPDEVAASLARRDRLTRGHALLQELMNIRENSDGDTIIPGVGVLDKPGHSAGSIGITRSASRSTNSSFSRTRASISFSSRSVCSRSG